MKKIIAVCIAVILVFSIAIPLDTYAWGDHYKIPEFARTIIENDLGTSITNDTTYQELMQYYNLILDAADDPDNLFNDVSRELFSEDTWWASHYFNPYTQKTYIGWGNNSPQIHCEYMAQKYMSEAVAKWKLGHKAEAAYNLGYALHFMEDATNPHHAALEVSIASGTHMTFESYVKNNVNRWRIYNVNPNSNTAQAMYLDTNNDNMRDFVKQIMIKYGKEAYAQYYSCAKYENINDSWSTAATITHANAQRLTALTIYRFVQEVKNANVNIKVKLFTADEVFAGTDDRVKLRLETADGNFKELLVDNLLFTSTGNEGDFDEINDFEQNTITTAHFSFYDPAFNMQNVNKMKLIKEAVWSSSGDDWKLARVDIDVNGINVFTRGVNKLLTGSIDTATIYTPGGLKSPSGADLGTIKVTVKTGEETTAGTNNEIYFGMELYNGMWVEYKLDSAGSDFDRGDIKTYTINNFDSHYQPEQIKKFRLRKYDGVSAQDSWKIESLSIKFWNKTSYAKKLNTWLSNENVYSWSVSTGEINTNYELIGHLESIITTSTGIWSNPGTDDNVYLGIRFSDGSTIEQQIDNSENNFNSGDIDVFFPCFNKKRSDVRKIYLRKAGNDDWKVYSAKFKIDGYTKHTKIINSWIDEDDSIYEWNKTGL